MKTEFSDYAWGRGGDRSRQHLAAGAPFHRRGPPDPAALARFLAEHGVRPDALTDGRAPSDAELDAVHALRQELRTTLEAATEEETVERANALIARAATGPALHRAAPAAVPTRRR
ncbi:ABATE domain-containing protein [Streptomyces sp. M19]